MNNDFTKEKAMKKPILFLIVCLVAAGLLLVACSKQAATPVTSTSKPVTTTTTAPTSKPVTATTTTTTTAVEKPQYGGTLTIAYGTDIQGWDHAKYPPGYLYQLVYPYDGLVLDDWAKGLAGTGQCDWSQGSQKRIEYTVGQIAESWEMPQQGTFIFHIRHGVHFALDPNNPASQLVGGREVTADDVVFSMNRELTSPTSYLSVSEPMMAKSTVVTKIDDYTVQVTTPPNCVDSMWLMLPGREVWAPEVIAKYGDVTDWHNTVGTGAFMVQDFVSGSAVTFARNPNYWEKDPVGTGMGNQLPYVDNLKILIMPDTSTALAALRTGKVDQLAGANIVINHDDAMGLIKSNPELQYKKFLSGSLAISMRTDKQDLPFKDVRVRQALMMATDFNTIKNQLDGGDDEILSFPLAPIKAYINAYMPMNELPADVQALYSYNLDKAKQLLTEAGYPDGFQTSIVTWNNPDYIDYLSAIKAMWAKIGVDVTIQPLEFGAYMGQCMSRQYDEMLYGFFVQPGPYAQLMNYRGQSTFNRSWVNDPKIEETYNEILKYDLIDQAKVDQLHHDIMPYVLSQAWYIPRPTPYVYNFWQPWLKNYHGEMDLGYDANWCKYIWIDQNLKKQMGK
jgi:peptide/nickel transport system substrate-binding protein